MVRWYLQAVFWSGESMYKLFFTLFAVLLTGGMQAQSPGVNFSNLTPAAPAGNTNITWQHDSSNPVNISGYLGIPPRGYAGLVTPEMYGAYGDNVHDDTAAIQACWDNSANYAMTCRMGSGVASGGLPYGTYLANGQLMIRPNTHELGNSQLATRIRSEYNGAAV